MSQYYLYRHVRPDLNVPFYIGIGTKREGANYKTIRRECDRAFSLSRSEYWKIVYGECKQHINVEIVYESNSKEEILEKEKEFIALYGRRDLGLGPLVNITDGGEGNIGLKHSEETRKKMSLKAKGRKKSEEHKLKIKLSNLNNPVHKLIWLGKKHKPETIEKMKLSKVGHKVTEIGKKRISEANKGNKYWVGKKHSEEVKNKMSEYRKLHPPLVDAKGRFKKKTG